jgi:hypothetical protein
MGSRQHVNFEAASLKVELPGGGTATVVGYVVAHDDSSLEIMARGDEELDRDELLAALDPCGAEEDEPAGQDDPSASHCPTCGSSSIGVIYSPCSVGGASEMANPNWERFPHADPWHLITRPDGSLTQPREKAAS